MKAFLALALLACAWAASAQLPALPQLKPDDLHKLWQKAQSLEDVDEILGIYQVAETYARLQNDSFYESRFTMSRASIEWLWKGKRDGIADRAAQALSFAKRSGDGLEIRNALWLLCMSSYQHGKSRLSDSLAYCNQADQADSRPDLGLSDYYRGQALMSAGRYADAAQVFQKATVNGPDALYEGDVGWALLEAGDVGGARKELEFSLKTAEGQPADVRQVCDLATLEGAALELTRGGAAQAAKRFVQAQASCEQSHAFDEDLAIELGLLRLRQGRRGDAKQLLVSAGPLGEAQWDLADGRPADAIDAVNQAEIWSSDDVVAVSLGLARAYAALGKKQEAGQAQGYARQELESVRAGLGQSAGPQFLDVRAHGFRRKDAYVPIAALAD